MVNQDLTGHCERGRARVNYISTEHAQHGSWRQGARARLRRSGEMTEEKRKQLGQDVRESRSDEVKGGEKGIFAGRT